jgi:uncharacterized protein involved in response to NO
MNATMDKAAGQIDHTMLVSDINRQFPQCRPVFEKYGIAGCGGEYGPPEPLFIFAAAHRVALPELLAELNDALAGKWKEVKRTAPDASLQNENLYKRFIFAALAVALTAGFGLGVVNLTRIVSAESYYAISGVLKQIHGHAQLFGWVGLFIMGVAFHAVPRMKMQPLNPAWAPGLCLILMVTGILLRVFSQPFAGNIVGGTSLLLSGALELAGIGLFLWTMGRVMAGSQQGRESYEKYIWASAGWLAVIAIGNFLITLQMFRNGWVGVPAVNNALLIHAGFFGFIANMIFAFSLRVLPHFLGLRHTKVWAADAAFVLWNVAIFLRYPHDTLAKVATTLETIAAVLFVYALGIFAKRRAKIEIQGVDNTFSWFIVLGYVWLLITAATPFHADIFRLSASSRHLMALGFITPIMFGVAYRVLPIFNGVNLHSAALMRVSFWLLAAGSTLSLSMAFNTAYQTKWSYLWSGAAGWLVLAAVVLFAWNLGKTLLTRAEPFTTRVAELLEVHPELRPVLIHGGLAGLAAMRHSPPRFVTIEFAARRHHLDPQPLIEALNAEIKRKQP